MTCRDETSDERAERIRRGAVLAAERMALSPEDLALVAWADRAARGERPDISDIPGRRLSVTRGVLGCTTRTIGPKEEAGSMVICAWCGDEDIADSEQDGHSLCRRALSEAGPPRSVRSVRESTQSPYILS